MSDEPKRSEWVYVTTTEPQQVVRVDAPHGLIMPPYLDLHEPLVGPHRFYHADSYQLQVRE